MKSHFSPSEWAWTVGKSKGVGGPSVIRLTPTTSLSGVQIKLAEDLFPSVVLTAPFLRFHLNREDIEEILRTPDLFSLFLQPHQEQLRRALPFASEKRREHALVGQGLLDDARLVLQYQRFTVIAASDFILNFSVRTWVDIETYINLNSNRPDGFAEFEDEDHDAEDEEDCSSYLEEDDFWDE